VQSTHYEKGVSKAERKEQREENRRKEQKEEGDAQYVGKVWQSTGEGGGKRVFCTASMQTCKSISSLGRKPDKETYSGALDGSIQGAVARILLKSSNAGAFHVNRFNDHCRSSCLLNIPIHTTLLGRLYCLAGFGFSYLAILLAYVTVILVLNIDCCCCRCYTLVTEMALRTHPASVLILPLTWFPL
jgi:hypothetical protein